MVNNVARFYSLSEGKSYGHNNSAIRGGYDTEHANDNESISVLTLPTQAEQCTEPARSAGPGPSSDVVDKDKFERTQAAKDVKLRLNLPSNIPKYKKSRYSLMCLL